MSGQLEHTIIFTKEIEEDNIQDLIDYINSYAFVNLYMSTNGGRLDIMNILIDFLNHRHEKGSLKLTLFDFVASAGTLLLTHYNGPIFVKDLRGFLFHAPDINSYTIRKDAFQKAMEEQLTVFNEEYYSELKEIGLSSGEIAKIRKGEDVYIFQKDFHRIKRDLFVGEETVTQHYIIAKGKK